MRWRWNGQRWGLIGMGAVAILGVGQLLPWWVATLGSYATGILILWRTDGDPSMLDDKIGMSLTVIQYRDGTWTPEYRLRPEVLSPRVAITCLEDAVARLRDDWDVPR